MIRSFQKFARVRPRTPGRPIGADRGCSRGRTLAGCPTQSQLASTRGWPGLAGFWPEFGPPPARRRQDPCFPVCFAAHSSRGHTASAGGMPVIFVPGRIWPDSGPIRFNGRVVAGTPWPARAPLVRPHPPPPARRRDRNVTRAAQGRGGGQVRRPSETAKRDRRNPDLRPISVTRECCQGLASPSTPKNSSHTPSSAGPGVSADGARGGLRGGVKSIVSRWRPARPWGRGAR